MSLYREVVMRGSLVAGGDGGSIYNSYGAGSVAGGEGNAGGLVGIWCWCFEAVFGIR